MNLRNMAPDAPARVGSDTLQRTPLVGGEHVTTQLPAIPIPPPRRQVMAQMMDLAALVRGPIEVLSFGAASCPAALRLSLAQITLVGTACSRPLLFDEGRELQQVVQDTIVIVRLDAELSSCADFSCDILMPNRDAWLERYRLWQPHTPSGLWLVPHEGEGLSIALSPWGTNLVGRAPFYSLDEREAGYQRVAPALHELREVR